MTKLCECGCGQPLKRGARRWATQACVPKAERTKWGRSNRAGYAYRRRAMAFRSDIERLGRTPTREDLTAVFYAIYRRAYNAGWVACERAKRTGDKDALRRARAREAA